MATTRRVFFSATSWPRSEGDWQGVFIRNMAQALAASGELELSIWAPPGPRPRDAIDACSAADTRFLAELAEAGGIVQALRASRAGGLASAARLVWRLHRACARAVARTDVYHLNWLQCALGLAGNRKPLLATVLGSDLALLERAPVRSAVRAVLRNRPAIVCPNAPWMIAPLRERLGDCGADIECVPFGIDERWYRAERRPAGRPHQWIVVLRVTRAKIGPLFEWTRDLDPAEHEVHLFGPMQEAIDVPPWVRYHGPATPDELAEQWFPSAAGMISLSEHAEGRPQVLLEAMAAGLPVLCSRIPAHADLVADGRTGLLAGSAQEFHDRLAWLTHGEHAQRIGAQARAEVRREFGTWVDCAQRYRARYDRLLAASRHGAAAPAPP